MMDQGQHGKSTHIQITPWMLERFILPGQEIRKKRYLQGKLLVELCSKNAHYSVCPTSGKSFCKQEAKGTRLLCPYHLTLEVDTDGYDIPFAWEEPGH